MPIRSPPSSHVPQHRHTPTLGLLAHFERPLVSFEAAEDAAGNATEHRHGWIVGMDSDIDPLLLGHRDYLLDEVLVVIPDLFFSVDPPVRQRTIEFFSAPVSFGRGEIEHARLGAAARKIFA